jgi:hypothetical protein
LKSYHYNTHFSLLISNKRRSFHEQYQSISYWVFVNR